jgi:4-amino-4-deoxy-L-arabinose transferase-like glycosyltransferase
MEVRDRRAGLWPVLLALLPLLPSLWFTVAKPWLPMSADDDGAVIEMAERRVLRGAQLTGVYSRFGFSHPGPVQLFLMAPVYAATGQRTAGLSLAALLVTALFTAAAAWSAARVVGPRRGLVAAAGLAVLLARMGPGWVAHAWGPHAVIVPFALLFVLALGFARRGAAWLPGLACVATFLVQTHLGTAVAVTCVAGASFVLAGRLGRRVASVRPVAISVALLALLWTPPVLEQLRGTPQQPGNFTLLWRFLTTHGASHTFVEVFGPLAHELGSIPVALVTALVPSTSDQRDVGAGLFALLLVALLPISLAAARRRRDDESAGLFWLALAGILAALFSALRVVGPVHDYLLHFVSAAAFAGWTALALSAAQAFEERGRGRAVGVACLVVGLLCTVGNARALRQQQPIPVETKEAVRTFAEALKTNLAAQGIRKPLVRLSEGEPWVPAAGALLELERNGADYAVEENWTVMFGRNRRATGAEDGTVWFVETAPAPDLKLLAESGKTKLYAAPGAAR